MKHEWYASINLIDKSIEALQKPIDEWYENTNTVKTRTPQWIHREELKVEEFKVIRRGVVNGSLSVGFRNHDTDIQQEES